MISIKNLKLSSKMSLVSLVVSLAVLLLATLSWLVSSYFHLRVTNQKNLQILTQVTANNLAAALQFENKSDAIGTLKALAFKPEIREALVYDKTGNIFATYFAQGEGGTPSFETTPNLKELENTQTFQNLEHILYDGKKIGDLYMKMSSGDLQRAIQNSLYIAGLVLFCAIILAGLLSSRMQRVVSQPINDLLQTVRKVGKDKDYSLRAISPNNDETGLLISGFNEMLKEIELRDKDLHRYREQLEDLVETRTSELKSSEARLRAIFDTAGDAIITFNTTGNIESANTAALKIFESQLDDLMGKPIDGLFNITTTLSSSESLVSALAKVEVRNSLNGKEYKGICKNGRQFPMEMSIAQVELLNEKIFVCILRDITLRKRAEEQLIRAKEAAENLAKTKAQFLANMSHEIRTPLNGIFGTTQLVLKTTLDDRQREFIEMMKFSGDSLLRIVNDVLNFSKLEAGKVELEQKMFVLKDQVENILGVFMVKASQVKVNLSVDFDPTVPEVVVSDSQRLGQVIINLVGNALKFTPPGGSVKIHVGLSEDNLDSQILKFSVSDTGIGIPKDKWSTVFEAFTQVDTSSTRQYGGTGLGLAIATNIVKLMGGQISLDSTPGAGSTFTFTIKVGKAHAQLNKTTTVTSGVIRSISKEGGQLLLVEDNQINQRIAQELLKGLGFEVMIAGNGQVALELMEKHSFQLVFMDCQMPVMDGFTAVAAIRNKEKTTGTHMPIVAMTAHAMEGDRERCLAAGMDNYISKPIEEERLKQVLAETLHTKCK